MSKSDNKGYVRRETMIAIAVACLFVGYLAGSLLKNVDIGGGSRNSAFQPSSPAPPAASSPIADIESLRQRAEDNPDNANLWIDLGNAYFDSGMYENAITAYARSLEIAPGNPDVLTDLGIMYRRTGSPPRAVEMFDEAIKADPEHTMSRFNKGVVLLYDLRDKKGAIEAWQELATIAPRYLTPTGDLIEDVIKELQSE